MPATVDPILSRGEFYTAYTPYQPEISQGTLQTIYEYQSLLAELTGLAVVSASHYDGAAATAEAALMTIRATGRERVLASRAIHRHYLETTRDVLRGRPASTLDELPTLRRRHDRPGRAGARAGGRRATRSRACCWASRTRSACWSRWPRPLGSPTPPAPCSWPSWSRSRWRCWRRPASTAPTSRSARASRWASRRSTAGPTSGFLAAPRSWSRQVPGRLVGRTLDLDGRRAYVMTLRAREQDIRRDKAASNICTNQALCALAATVYIATLGPHGLRDVAAVGAARRAQLEAALAAAGVPRVHSGAYLNEFAVRVPDAPAVHAALLDRGVLAGLPLARWYPDDPATADALLVCATEVTTDADIERFASAPRRGVHSSDRPSTRLRCATRGDARRLDAAVGAALQPTLAELSGPGRAQRRCRTRRPTRWPASRPTSCGRTPAGLPELTEPEVMRHFVNLSQLNYSVDGGFYPLGSCTMKYNPKINEWAARLPGFAALHPLAPDAPPRARSSCCGSCERCSPRSAACTP